MPLSIVSVVGNIGAGKSTYMDRIKKEGLDSKRPIVFLDEPLEEWEKIETDRPKKTLNLFGLYSDDPESYSFAFQSYVFVTRYLQLRKVKKNNPDAIVIMERGVWDCIEVFARTLRERGLMKTVEYFVLLTMAKEFLRELD
jgi:deoxyadenosine/deoxycytidine kinase